MESTCKKPIAYCEIADKHIHIHILLQLLLYRVGTLSALLFQLEQLMTENDFEVIVG
jgi:hypothetical protein